MMRRMKRKNQRRKLLLLRFGFPAGNSTLEQQCAFLTSVTSQFKGLHKENEGLRAPEKFFNVFSFFFPPMGIMIYKARALCALRFGLKPRKAQKSAGLRMGCA